MTVIVMGKTASGKDTVVNKLIDRGYHKIITYTTRPMRPNEEQDKTYHFVSDEEFIHKVEDGFFAEWKSFNTVKGKWYYGSAKQDYSSAINNSVIILNPDGVKDVLSIPNLNPTVIYVYSNTATIKKRLAMRGDAKEEAERRMLRDYKDFEQSEMLADRIFYNNDGKDIEELVDEIIKYLERIESNGKH